MDDSQSDNDDDFAASRMTLLVASNDSTGEKAESAAVVSFQAKSAGAAQSEGEVQRRKRVRGAALSTDSRYAEIVESSPTNTNETDRAATEATLPERVPPPEVSVGGASGDDSFGTAISSKPMDSNSIRAIVHSRDDGAGVGNTGNESAVEDSDIQRGVESAHASHSAANDTLARDDTDAFSVDENVTEVPMLLLGIKKTSKDKFYNLHVAMKSTGISFIDANVKEADGTIIEPAVFELHKLVFSKQDDVRQLVEDKFSDETGMVDLVKKCWQVSRKKGDGDESTVEVCLYLRIDPSVTTGLEGEAATCEKFDDLRKSEYIEGAGLALALEKKTIEKIAKNKDAATFLHPLVLRSVSRKRPKEDTSPAPVYVRMDEVPMNDKDEHESFLFRLAESKTASKRAPRGATNAGKNKVAAARVSKGSTVLVGDTSSLQSIENGGPGLPPGQKTIQEVVRSSPENQEPPVAMDTDSSPCDSAMSDAAASASTITEPSRAAQQNDTAIVIHSTDDAANKASIWNDLVSKASAMAPPFPHAPELVHFPYDPSKVTLVPCGTSGFMLQIAR